MRFAGLHKSKYWDPIYEDSLDLIAKLPTIAATIYRNTYYKGTIIRPEPDLDWAGNLALMMGTAKSNTPALDMMRMYQTIHAGAWASE
jgi:citrate synthase